ncbi:MAG TPA: hypothetical protein VKA70_17900 [Blastocatellia bacterium]|nr:hypothetical protein [Blastocatellia bacterium]
MFIWISAAALIAAAAFRYFADPTFWLDEAFVAVSLKNPSPDVLFAPLEYGQYFPRLYLAAIAALRETLGYRMWVLRLLPWLSFIAATILWARLLVKRSKPAATAGLFAASLLAGSIFWLDQAVQLKQYTLDVLLALIPFIVGDELLEKLFARGERKPLALALVLPIVLSYTYPMALGARLLGWYLSRGRAGRWRLNKSTVVITAVVFALTIVSIWATDYRFNFKDSASYFFYWDNCILRSRLAHGFGETTRLIAKFLWGWHARQPMVTAVVAPLQIVGVYSVIRRWKRREQSDSEWGSRSIGSILLIGGVMLASLVANYPICAGRVTLFAQIHLQVLAVEGALFVLARWDRNRAVAVASYVLIAVILFHSVRQLARFVRAEPEENLRPVIALIDRQAADTVWVHPCSVVQVRSLPDPLPAGEVLLGSEMRVPPSGRRVWIIWSHLGEESCRARLEQLQQQAGFWETVHTGPGRGLALAEFGTRERRNGQ